ncbi:MAG: hypothetical protein KAR14_13960, partial [Candidatus Aminicenantes bacterium]|nr:hypothetical protein [Candidatus Aminicenantes bacterium]
PAETGCLGDSGAFTIGTPDDPITFQPMTVEAHFIKPPDLEIKIIPIPASPDIYQKTLVEFRVKNIGQGSSKATKMKVFMGTSNTDTWDVKPLDPGRFMYKTKSITPGGVGYIMWSANVDENNNIGDKNRANNYTKYKMIVKGPDLKITNVNTPDYKKTIQQKCTMNVTVTNIGHTKSGKFEIDCDMDTCPLIAQGRKFRVHPGLAPGQSATFQFTHRYACFKMVGVDFYVDKNNQVKEENENNNECGLPFHISGDNIGKKKTPWSSNCN